jgi:hypothetical protein
MKILEFEYYGSENLTPSEEVRVKDWVKKYEKYFNFQDSENFENSLNTFVEDLLDNVNINPSKKESIKRYMQDMYNLSDGMTLIMSPYPELNYNGIDQVQRFQY